MIIINWLWNLFTSLGIRDFEEDIVIDIPELPPVELKTLSELEPKVTELLQSPAGRDRLVHLVMQNVGLCFHF